MAASWQTTIFDRFYSLLPELYPIINIIRILNRVFHRMYELRRLGMTQIDHFYTVLESKIIPQFFLDYPHRQTEIFRFLHLYPRHTIQTSLFCRFMSGVTFLCFPKQLLSIKVSLTSLTNTNNPPPLCLRCSAWPDWPSSVFLSLPAPYLSFSLSHLLSFSPSHYSIHHCLNRWQEVFFRNPPSIM